MAVHASDDPDATHDASENRKRDALRAVSAEFTAPEEITRRRLRDFRKIRGLTEEGLATLARDAGAKLTGKKVSEIETGKRRVRVGELFVLAHVLEVPLIRLLTPEEGDETEHVRISDWYGLTGTECRNWIVLGDARSDSARETQTMMRATLEFMSALAIRDDPDASDVEKQQARAAANSAMEALRALVRPGGAARRARLARRSTAA